MVGVIGSCRHEGCLVRAGGACAIDKNPIDCDWFDPVAESERGELIESAESAGSAPNDGGADPILGDLGEATTDLPDEKEIESGGGELPVSPVPSNLRNQVVFSDRSVEFRPMGALSPDHADDVLAQEPASVILLVGPAQSGKTTLIARIVEEFERGPIGTWSFAGSHSLLGFMRRSYLARLASGNPYATTLRTRHAEIDTPWLHLRVHDGMRSQALLLADVSGEYFRNLASGADLGEARGIAQRADHLVYLVDCASYVNRRTRQQVVTAFRGMARRIVETDVAAKNARHTILMTKVDCLEDAAVAEQLRTILEEIAATYLGGAAVLSSAARPKDHGNAIGISELIDALASPPPSGKGRTSEPFSESIPRPLAKIAGVGGEVSAMNGLEGGAE